MTSSFEQLRDWWNSLVRKWWFRATYLVLLGVLSALLFPFAFGATVCLILIVVPLTIFAVPYWLGERKARRFVENGVVILVIAIVLLSALQTQSILSAPELEIASSPGEGQDPTMSLANGTVRPYRSEGPTSFTFQVRLSTTDDAAPGDFDVWLNLTIVDSFAATNQSYRMVPVDPSGNTRNGTLYQNETALGGALYFFWFAVERKDTGNWTRSGFAIAPIAASAGTVFAVFLVRSILFLVFILAFYLFIVYMWWWTSRRRRLTAPARRAEADTEEGGERAEVEGEEKRGMREAGGRAAKAAAFTCTNCGADVTEDARSCPKCGAAFED